MAIRYVNFSALLIILATMLWVWGYASQHSYAPCIQDCGETLIAEQAAANYRLYGFKYGLLEDHATFPDAERKPYLYTHNMHIGSLLFTLFEILGIHALAIKQLPTLLAFALGLFYIYRTITYLSKSNFIGICVLILFATEYSQVLAFGLHALRGWHWLGLFGLSFHILRQCIEKNPTYSDRFGIFVFSVINFCIGYEFLAICFFVNLFIICFNSGHKFSRQISTFSWLVFSILTIFTIRQLQVISVMGFHFWSSDFLYSVGIKLTSLSGYIKLPPLNEIDQFYQNYNTFRPGSSPAPLYQLWLGFIRQLKTLIFPTAGIGSTISLIVGMWLSFGIIFYKKKLCPLKYIYLGNCAKFYTAFILGSCVGILIFGGVSISIYMKHEFPLLIAPFLLAKGFLLGATIKIIINWYLSKKSFGLMLVIIPICIILDHGLTQFSNQRAIKPMSVGWIPSVQANPKNSYAVSWNSLAITPFNKNWSIGIKPGIEMQILEKLKRHQAPFAPENLIASDQQDSRPIENINILQPDFWVYFPFDSRATLKRDWPSKTLNRLFKADKKHVQNEFFQEIDSVLIANPALKVLARGKDYIILDLREVWQSLDNKSSNTN